MAAKTAIDIDRIAREATRKGSMKEARDYVLNPPPMTPFGYQILVQPIRAGDTIGSSNIIAAADISMKAEEYQIKIARVIKVGPTALQGKTSSGIELGYLDPSIKGPADLIGKFVLHQPYSGIEVILRDTDDKFLVLTVSELLAMTDEPQAWRFYL